MVFERRCLPVYSALFGLVTFQKIIPPGGGIPPGYIAESAETGYNHLKSRYYSPEVGRFLNVDGYVQTGQGLLDINMFAYCGNNPVNRRDNNCNAPYKHSKKAFLKI